MKQPATSDVLAVALAVAFGAYALGRSHGVREQKEQRLSSDLSSVKSQLSFLQRQLQRDSAAKEVPA